MLLVASDLKYLFEVRSDSLKTRRKRDGRSLISVERALFNLLRIADFEQIADYVNLRPFKSVFGMISAKTPYPPRSY